MKEYLRTLDCNIAAYQQMLMTCPPSEVASVTEALQAAQAERNDVAGKVGV